MNGLHPRVQIRWGLVRLVSLAVLGVIVAAVDRFAVSLPSLVVAGAAAVLVPLLVVHVVLLYRSWRYQLEPDALALERGVLTRVETAVPYVRVQHVDTRRGPLDRLLGLGNVVVYTAGSRGADVTIPGLRPAEAKDLRNELRDLAIESEPEDAV